ncbi:MAG: type III pantothenate kinase [Muribaculaceae bacterium]|nr:type III pantothenate kinase [Muribaculaceae bacterium]
MNVLTVDIGNTKVKLDIWSGDKHLFHDSIEKIEMLEPEGLKDRYDVEGVIICSVKDMDLWKYADIQNYFDNVSRFPSRPEENYDIIESYRGQLGADRRAAFLGALTLFPEESMLVVDAGTALTIDYIDEKGKFCGGNISLGLEGRLRALHEYTSLLPKVSSDGEVTDFGATTELAIRDGAYHGIVGEIKFMAEKANQKKGVDKVVMTGGDAEKIIPYLRENGVEVCFDPYLVGRGLNADFRSQGFKYKLR